MREKLPFSSAVVCATTLPSRRSESFAPGTAEEETQNYAVKRGTYVTFASSTGNQLYADAELTQSLDDTQPIDTSGESMTVYVVPDAAQG